MKMKIRSFHDEHFKFSLALPHMIMGRSVSALFRFYFTFYRLGKSHVHSNIAFV